MTIQEIKTANDTTIRQKTLPGSILKTEDANLRDGIADELLNRGVVQVLASGDLGGESHLNTNLVLVAGNGLFQAFESNDAPDGETTFASADSGWLWLRILTAMNPRDKFSIDADYDYVLADGYMIDRILLKPTAADTVKIGLTDGGDEVMYEEQLAADEYKSVLRDVIADGADVTLYLRGITDTTTVIIYKRKI